MIENHDNHEMSKALKETIHDLNNIFTSSIASIEQLQSLLESNPPAQKLLNNLNRNSLRAVDILNSLTGSSKIKRDILLETLLADVIATVKLSSKKNIKINLSLENNLAKTNGNYTDLYRAFLNLTVNALESIEDNGIINLEVECNIDDGTINVSVKDNGIGISEKDLKRIFDSGFSTKEKENESGHGLAIVKEIIVDHGGSVFVTSKQNKGTHFLITLPASKLDNTMRIENRSSKILLVDDDKVILELFSDLLESYNYSVVTADCGDSALKTITDSKGFDLLIIDKTIPGINGLDLILKIRENNFSIPIILMSGSHETINMDLSKLKINKRIKKPFDFDFMLNEIKKLLN